MGLTGFYGPASDKVVNELASTFEKVGDNHIWTL